MADANIVSLQNAVNRFAKTVGFTALNPDGGMGDKTLKATQAALDYLSIEIDDGTNGLSPVLVAAAQAARASAATNTVSLATYAHATADVITTCANALGLPIVVVTPSSSTRVPIPSSNPIIAAASPTGLFLSISNTWKGFETWQKVAIGLLAGLGVMWTAHHFRTRRGGSLHGVRVRARRRGRAAKSYMLVEA